MSDAREREIQAAVIDELDDSTVWHINVQGGGAGRNGIPDIVGGIAGTAIAWEIKRPGQRCRPHQVRELWKAHDAGIIAAVVTSRDQARTLIQLILAGQTDVARALANATLPPRRTGVRHLDDKEHGC